MLSNRAVERGEPLRRAGHLRVGLVTEITEHDLALLASGDHRASVTAARERRVPGFAGR